MGGLCTLYAPPAVCALCGVVFIVPVSVDVV